MLERFRAAGLVWPTVLALGALAVLVGLGTWQLQRKAWKEDLIAKIAARVHAPPVPFERVIARAAPDSDVEYVHVTALGRFHHDKERYLYAPEPAGLAWQVLTPLELVGDPGHIVWVNRGTVPDLRKAPESRREGQIEGQVSVSGLLRRPQAGAFTPSNDVAHNVWYWPDIAALTQSAFGSGGTEAAQVVLEADAAPAPPGDLPRGGVTRIAIPNRHLEYALTWYGLALTLIGVYVAFALSRLRDA